MKNIFLIVFLLGSLNGFTQVELNNYKYIIVPKKFDCFRKENQYKTSTLLKYLFNQEGFTAVYDDALPEDLNSDRCLGLLVFINDESSMFTTKTSLLFKDCYSKEIFRTPTGSSKEKEYNSAYNEALTEAFGTIKALDYKYSPKNEKSEPIILSFKNDVKTVGEDKAKVAKNKPNKAVEQVATPETQLYKSKEPVESTIVKAEPGIGEVAKLNDEVTTTLYAQEIPKGFQLVDNSPKVRIKIYKTSIPDYYIAEAVDKNGVVYKKMDKWFFDYYVQDILKTEELHIKF